MSGARELKERIEKLELENRVMRDYINHRLLRDAERGFAGFLASEVFHDGENCNECTRMVATFSPAQPWRGWAL